MAVNNNTTLGSDLYDLDPDEILVSAFENQDEFKPKVYMKHRAFGKRRSFLCYKNPAFDASLDAIEEGVCPSSDNSCSVNLAENDDLYDIVDSCGDDIKEVLPSSKQRKARKPGSLRQRRAEKLHKNVPAGHDHTDYTQSFSTSKKGEKAVGRWKQFKYGISLKWDHFKNGFKNFFKDIDIWKSNLKAVEGKFGSGVLSYFKFLRWLFLLDLVITVIILAFVVAPQLMYKPSYNSNNVTFTGLEFLTGEGWFRQTEMYLGTYGGYKNDTVILSYDTPYNLPLAYLAVAGGYILLCVLILVRSMAISYNKNHISGKDFRNSFFTIVFCSWDYAVTLQGSADLQCKNIYIDLMESLTESREKRKKNFKESCDALILRLVTHTICIGLNGGACYLIYWARTKGATRIKDSIVETELTKVFISLFPAIMITMLNIILPFVFRIIASLEKYESPRITIEISLFRTVVLKLSTLCVYVWLVYNSIGKSTPQQNVTATNGTTIHSQISTCWETTVGVQIYQLAVVDFVFLLLVTFFGEMVRHTLASCMNASLGLHLDLPGFDISRNVLDLIYAQGLCWLGAFFCPMLPLITIIKFFILFYYKKASVLRFCRPSMRPFKASKMHLRFLILLSFMLALAMVVIGYVITHGDRLQPSKDCGPFRGKANIFALVKIVIDRDFDKETREITKSISSSIAFIMIFFILGIIIYYQKLRKSSAEKKIKLLKAQISLAGQDKMFLLREIRSILKQRANGHMAT